jgi:hypothetical protein
LERKNEWINFFEMGLTFLNLLNAASLNMEKEV